MKAEKVDVQLELEAHFKKFREHTLGNNLTFTSPYGEKKVIYADWIASGRMYGPIEKKLGGDIANLVANTHTETSHTGAVMTQAYAEAKQIIKKHVNASCNDVLIPTGTGMTGAVLKLQRILGLKFPEKVSSKLKAELGDCPVVFISHMEHHSNHTSWLETLADVVVIPPTEDGLFSIEALAKLLDQYKDRKVKIASITSCSNVTGIFTPYFEVAKLMHKEGGLCFVDFAASGPYVDINMHPDEEGADLDAIFFSPHKFLGGPGSAGVLIFNKSLYRNQVPDQPGGGTVTYTNPWGEHHYIDDIETREDGGTPGFLQTIRAAMAMRLKEQMEVKKMQERERYLINYTMDRLEQIQGLKILAGQHRERIGAISFYIEGIHYNLVCRLLNDLHGIQVRGGCSCAGTYGHYLLNVGKDLSHRIMDKVDNGDLSDKPGWVRLSIHPIITYSEAEYICNAIADVAENYMEYAQNYEYSKRENDFCCKVATNENIDDIVKDWFKL